MFRLGKSFHNKEAKKRPGDSAPKPMVAVQSLPWEELQQLGRGEVGWSFGGSRFAWFFGCMRMHLCLYASIMIYPTVVKAL